MTGPEAQAAAARRAAGLFRLDDRGLLAVEGADRVRWLDGMVSNDVAALAPGPERSGCYALLLTPKGRIVADLHVLHRDQALWLETARAALADVVGRLEKLRVADDVRLVDRSAEFDRLALEGPAAPGILEAVGAPLPVSPDAWVELELAGTGVLAAAYGWSGESAFQLFAPAGAGGGVAEALRAAGAGRGLVEAGPEALEILRIEAGVPRLGAELDEDVFPAEAGLERAVSSTKGCYTGQEIVARLGSRGRVNHRLVGLSLSEGGPPAPGARVEADSREVGEVTSACRSPAAGSIALAFLRLPWDAPGTEVRVAGRAARVAPLPFTGSP